MLPAAVYVALLTAVRNAVTARLLGPEQFGLAAIFLLMQQFLDLTTETGLNRFLLQSKIGNRPAVQAMAQSVAAIRGAVIALLLAAIAWPAFAALGLATSIVPFLLLGAMALSIGFLHYDNARLQRQNRFANDSLSSMAGETMAFLAVLVALIFTRSYLVAVIAITARAMAITATSHLLARRRYILRWSATIAPVIMAYSWPLLLNGPLLFVSSQADRLLVSTMLGVRELGIYSATLLLLYLPLGLLMRVVTAVYAPRLSAAHHTGSIATVETEFIGTVLTVNLAAACGFAAIGPIAMVVLYGEAYSLAALPVAMISLMHCMRSMRNWPVGIALAVGRTNSVLIANVLRLFALPLGVAGVLISGGISGLAAGLLLGEALALLASLALLNRKRNLPARKGLGILAIFLGVSLVLPSALWMFDPGPLGAAIFAVFAFAIASLIAAATDKKLLPRDLKAFGW